MIEYRLADRGRSHGRDGNAKGVGAGRRRRHDRFFMNPADPTIVAMVAAKAVVAALIYALPAILAAWWRHPRPERVAMLNLLLGWTGIGWLVLLSYVIGRRVRSKRWSGRRPRSSRADAGLRPHAQRGNTLSLRRLRSR